MRTYYHSTGKRRERRGFTLLLAALVASVVVTIGTAIFTITIKQIALSALARDSSFAFYAADTGAECAFYWDYTYNYFDITPPVPAVTPYCDGHPLNAESTRDGSYPQTMEFSISIGSNRCSVVTVTKRLNAQSSVVTVIHADGYSVDCASYGANERAVQRSEEIEY